MLGVGVFVAFTPAALPVESVLAGVVVSLVGVGYRLVRLCRQQRGV
jgi:hypothetical protein